MMLHYTENEVFQETADLDIFNEEILNEKLFCVCSVTRLMRVNLIPIFLPRELVGTRQI